MSTFYRRLIYVLLGLAGGLAAWPLLELLLRNQTIFSSYLGLSVATGAAFGAVFGLFLGFADGIIAANSRRTVLGGLFGGLWGLLGGALGFVLGQWLLLLLGHQLFTEGVPLDSTALPMVRVLGWVVLGIFVGTSEGIRRRSLRKLLTGIAGGLLGGLLGGVTLEYASRVVSEAQARPLGLLLFGGLVALAYGLVEKSLSFGVLRLLNGTYKGKEYILNQRRLRIGADPSADVPLKEYRRVLEGHGLLTAEKGDLYLEPATPGAEIRRNDKTVPPDGLGPLKFGDVIQVGSAKLLYLP